MAMPITAEATVSLIEDLRALGMTTVRMRLTVVAEVHPQLRHPQMVPQRPTTLGA